MLDSLAGPFPGIRFMPSGGVGAGNAVDYLAHPSVFAISGSWMATRATIAAADFEGIRAASAEAMGQVR
jgi:2-dehydro-3-deoxyphosphogluconate aldolase/(4S)-4-hydroxy-2-oxoglutarate aldolase